MISYNDAFRIVKDNLAALPKQVEEVQLINSTGRILAEDIISCINLPPFRNSAMDGYAVVFSDAEEWEVTGTVAAGNYKNYSSGLNSAIEIMTGAKIPEGFDTVIPVEDIKKSGSRVKLVRNIPFKKGINIRDAGEDLKSGELILPEGRFIKSKDIAALASVGKNIVPVYKKLKTAVLATGDELVEININPENDKIRGSNLYTLLAAVIEAEMEPVNLGIIKDDKDLMRAKINNFLKSDNDILITTGGVSAGRYDFLKELFIEAGIEILFHKVNIKPGKPVLFGRAVEKGNTKLIFGLPGNPVSSLVTFIIFIRRALMMLRNTSVDTIPAVLQNDIVKKDTRRHFLRGKIENKENGILVSCSGSQSSGNIAQMASSECLVIIEENRDKIQKGESVNCILI
jgi:molybdopterin molybdotransferase